MLQPSYHGQVDRLEVDMGNAQGKRVVVIGAGIVGASLAYHLADKSAHFIKNRTVPKTQSNATMLVFRRVVLRCNTLAGR